MLKQSKNAEINALKMFGVEPLLMATMYAIFMEAIEPWILVKYFGARSGSSLILRHNLE